MRKIFIILLLVTSFTITSCSGQNESKAKSEKSEKQSVETVSVNENKSDQKAQWIGFDDGIKKSAKEKKHMIVDFYTDWCHWCKVMDEKTFSAENINDKLVDSFVTVRINAEDPNATATYKNKTYSNVELTQAFGVRGFPSLAFLDSAGEIITIVPGYVPPETFIYILEYVDQECYKKQMPFDEFMKKKGKCDDNKTTKS